MFLAFGFIHCHAVMERPAKLAADAVVEGFASGSHMGLEVSALTLNEHCGLQVSSSHSGVNGTRWTGLTSVLDFRILHSVATKRIFLHFEIRDPVTETRRPVALTSVETCCARTIYSMERVGGSFLSFFRARGNLGAMHGQFHLSRVSGFFQVLEDHCQSIRPPQSSRTRNLRPDAPFEDLARTHVMPTTAQGRRHSHHSTWLEWNGCTIGLFSPGCNR